MSVDQATVRRIAHLARIKVPDDEVAGLQGELNAILAFVETLSEVDVEDIAPMTSVMPMPMKKRTDVVSDGEIASDVIANAPGQRGSFFYGPEGYRVITDMCKCSRLMVSARTARAFEAVPRSRYPSRSFEMAFDLLDEKDRSKPKTSRP